MITEAPRAHTGSSFQGHCQGTIPSSSDTSIFPFYVFDFEYCCIKSHSIVLTDKSLFITLPIFVSFPQRIGKAFLSVDPQEVNLNYFLCVFLCGCRWTFLFAFLPGLNAGSREFWFLFPRSALTTTLPWQICLEIWFPVCCCVLRIGKCNFCPRF